MLLLKYLMMILIQPYNSKEFQQQKRMLLKRIVAIFYLCPSVPNKYFITIVMYLISIFMRISILIIISLLF